MIRITMVSYEILKDRRKQAKVDRANSSVPKLNSADVFL